MKLGDSKMITNPFGFTMTELLIAAGLSSVVMVGIGYVFTNVATQRDKAYKGLESLSDEVLVERVIIKDMMRSSPSFNVFKSKFFDYIPDARCNSDCTRSYIMQAGGEFWMLVADSEDVGTPTSFDPPRAYDSSVSGSTVTLAFNSTKLKSYMNSKNESGEKIFKKMWSKGNFLMFYSPVPLRVQPTDPVPRFFGFIGQVDASENAVNLVNPTIKGADGAEDKALSMNHPLSGAEITTMDQMLRTIPPVGGTGYLLFVRPVKIVKYRIDHKGTFSRAEVRQISGATAPQEFVIAKKVKQVTFLRDTIASTVIKYRMMWDKPTTGASPAPSASASGGI